MKFNPKFLLLLIPIAVLAIILLLPLGGGTFSSGEIIAQSSEQRDDRLAVRAYIAKEETFSNQLFSTGSVLANEEVMLRPEISGRITGLFLNEGQRVSAGELLVKINDSELQAELRRAEYRKNLAEIREQRMKSLVERNAVAQEEYDTALNELNIVLAEIELIKARIDQTEIRAPFNGVVGLKNVSLGSYITPNTDIASFQSLDQIKIDFSVPERYSGAIRNGQQFRFNRQGSTNTYNGSVFAIEPRIDMDTRTLRIRGIAPGSENRVLPGSFVEVRLDLSEVENAIMIPSEAVIPEMGGQRVFYYSNGSVQSKSIDIGFRTENRVHVTSGIAPGDTIITTGVLQIRPGMPVRIAEFQ